MNPGPPRSAGPAVPQGKNQPEFRPDAGMTRQGSVPFNYTRLQISLNQPQEREMPADGCPDPRWDV